MLIILNLAGEGEDPEAFDVNSLASPVRPPREFVVAGKFIQGDLLRLPIRAASVDEVRGRMVPLFLPDGHDRQLSEEAIRVLKSGGRLRLSTSLPPELVLPALRAAGFVGVRIEGGYAIGGKP